MTTQPLLDVPPGFDDLSKEEQIEYVQALWNRIATNEADVPVPEWHGEIVPQRLARADAKDGESWSKARERLRARCDD